MKEFFFNEVSGQNPATLLKLELLNRYFSIVFSAAAILQKTSKHLFLPSSHMRSSQRDVLQYSYSTKSQAQCVVKIFKKTPRMSSFLLKWYAYYKVCRTVDLWNNVNRVEYSNLVGEIQNQWPLCFLILRQGANVFYALGSSLPCF